MRPEPDASPADPWSPRLSRGSALALVVTGLAALLCLVLEPLLDAHNLLLVYTSGVVLVAIRAGRAPALLATGASILVFDLIQVPPRWSFKPTDPQYYFTFVLMAAFGWLVGELSMRLRAEVTRSEGRSGRAQALARFASQLVRARDLETVQRAACEAVSEATGRPCTLLHPGAAGEAVPGGAGDLALPLRGAEGPLGCLLVHDLPAGTVLPLEQRELLQAMADQTALAIERDLYGQRSMQARVESEAERLRSTLLASISHDFRTPLTTIVGSATSLLEQWQALDGPRRRALLQGVLSESRRLHTLSSNLLELTRLERGLVQPRCEWCPVEDLVSEALAGVGTRLERHRLACRIPGESVVWCDPGLLEQALVNLLENAARHTLPGTEVRVSAEVQARAGTWTLEVSDDGPGFPAPIAAALPASPRFERSGAVSSGGLGLAICAAIAKLHGGQLSIAARPGARVTLTLPLPAMPPELDPEFPRTP